MIKQIAYIFTLFFSLLSWSQTDARLTILNDSIKIGETFQVSLSYTHRAEAEVFFPDSTFDYQQLTYLKHQPYPTQTDSLSTDSAIYTFVHFEITDSLSVELPVYVLSKNDSIEVLSNRVFFHTKRTITQLPDSLALKTQLDYFPIPKPFNTPLYLTILGVSVVCLIALLLVFRHQIKRWIKHYFLQKKFNKIIAQLQAIIANENYNASTLNQFSGLVKKALALLYKKPFPSYTTAQIKAAIEPPFDADFFTQLDQHIYKKSDGTNFKTTLAEIITALEQTLAHKLTSKDE